MLKNVKLTVKLPALIVVMSVVTALITGVTTYWRAKNEVLILSEMKATGVTSGKDVQLRNYLNSIKEDLITVAAGEGVEITLKDFDRAYRAIGPGAAELLQKTFITDNPHPLGEKNKLERAENVDPRVAQYNEVHDVHHDTFNAMVNNKGYYDVFLFNSRGDNVYTVFKELDFGTNANKGKWKDTDFAEAFRASRELKEGEVKFFDFHPYGPSANAPASFIVTPIYDGEDNIGALMFQMPVSRINDIIKDTKGLLPDSHIFLVGEDHLIRAEVSDMPEAKILEMEFKNEFTEAAFAGKH